jgi:hypothetical protein
VDADSVKTRMHTPLRAAAEWRHTALFLTTWCSATNMPSAWSMAVALSSLATAMASPAFRSRRCSAADTTACPKVAFLRNFCSVPKRGDVESCKPSRMAAAVKVEGDAAQHWKRIRTFSKSQARPARLTKEACCAAWAAAAMALPKASLASWS